MLLRGGGGGGGRNWQRTAGGGGRESIRGGIYDGAGDTATIKSIEQAGGGKGGEEPQDQRLLQGVCTFVTWTRLAVTRVVSWGEGKNRKNERVDVGAESTEESKSIWLGHCDRRCHSDGLGPEVKDYEEGEECILCCRGFHAIETALARLP